MVVKGGGGGRSGAVMELILELGEQRIRIHQDYRNWLTEKKSERAKKRGIFIREKCARAKEKI